MYWKKAALITQGIGALVVIGAILMADNEVCTTEYIAQKIMLGCVIAIAGLLWECGLGELYHAREMKRICKRRNKPHRKAKKRAHNDWGI